MCGICGLIVEDPAQAEPAVRRMMRAMVHRGPDDEGYEEFRLGSEGGPVAAFGFRRLSILDLTSAGHQPMVNRETGDCLIFNGEIYNFADIRRRLEAKGVEVHSSGDTEVLLKALSTWGERALDELEGMFAFAFYEAQTHRILLARDHVGVKPLYFARGRWGFVFASEVQAVLASGLVPSDLDPAGIATFLAYGSPQDPLTVHRAIRSMPSGTCQWVGAEAARGKSSAPGRRYWRFPSVGVQGSAAEIASAIRETLDQSIAEQCVCDVPMAVFLSAGIDSATIAAFARNHVATLQTFAVGAENSPKEDETAEAAETARFLGTTHYRTMLDDEWVHSEWKEWLLLADRPTVDGLNTHIVTNAVKATGITVALAGLGADELFGGYLTFSETRRLHQKLAALAWAPLPLRRSLAPALAWLLPPSKRARAAHLLSMRRSYLDIALDFHRMHSDENLKALGFDRAQLGLSEHWLPAEAYETFVDVNRELFHTVSQVETFIYLGNTLLRDADWSSMANSVEIRVPFLSKRLMNLVGAIPGSAHFPSGPQRKRLLRAAIRGLLSDEIMSRPKRGFHLPITAWMDGPLRESSEAALERVAGSSLFSGKAVRGIWSRDSLAFTDRGQSRRLAFVSLGGYLRRSQAPVASLPGTAS